MDSQIYSRLLILEKHLELAYEEIRSENYDETTRLILNALSTTSQLQEILENEKVNMDRSRGEGQEEVKGNSISSFRTWLQKGR